MAVSPFVVGYWPEPSAAVDLNIADQFDALTLKDPLDGDEVVLLEDPPNGDKIATLTQTIADLVAQEHTLTIEWGADVTALNDYLMADGPPDAAAPVAENAISLHVIGDGNWELLGASLAMLSGAGSTTFQIRRNGAAVTTFSASLAAIEWVAIGGSHVFAENDTVSIRWISGTQPDETHITLYFRRSP